MKTKEKQNAKLSACGGGGEEGRRRKEYSSSPPPPAAPFLGQGVCFYFPVVCLHTSRVCALCLVRTHVSIHQAQGETKTSAGGHKSLPLINFWTFESQNKRKDETELQQSNPSFISFVTQTVGVGGGCWKKKKKKMFPFASPFSFFSSSYPSSSSFIPILPPQQY